MSTIPLHHFCNKDFARRLSDLSERNVLLLMIDGSAAFGRISRIDDCVLTLVGAFGIAGIPNLVQFRPPADNLPLPIFVSELEIDVCDIAHVLEGPFITSPLIIPVGVLAATGEVPSDTVPTPDFTKYVSRTANQILVNRQQCELLEELESLENQNVGIVTLGGWTILGSLGEVSECVSLIGPASSLLLPLVIPAAVTILGPVFFPFGVLIRIGTFRVWTNLTTLTQVILL